MIHTMFASRRCLFLYCGLILTSTVTAQDSPVILQVDVENWVNYALDVNDLSKLAQTPGPVPASPATNYTTWVSFMDITAINGSPVKGTIVARTQGFNITPNPKPGQAIGDVTRTAYQQMNFEILKSDGSLVGNIYTMGLNGGTPPPGSPAGVLAGNFAIVGGTGAFIGARGAVSPYPVQSPRTASQTEDPSARRINGGGKGGFWLQIWPMIRPEVVMTSTGVPMILHSDWTPVSTAKPAERGEVLIAISKGLGPTVPNVSPGNPFPSDPFAIVASPVEVLVNGKPSPAINQVGLPGTTDMYHIGFRVPDDAASGVVSVQVSAAWVRGAAVKISIR